VVGAIAARACGVAAREAMAPAIGVADLGRHSVYSEPVLFNLTILFWVERYFTDRANGSNSIEHQLLVVK
jgi:hypothetical protein